MTTDALLTFARPKLERYARRSCLISDVDDAVQEALLTLSRHFAAIRHSRALSAWLFRVVRRECHKMARKSLRVDLWEDERSERVLSTLSTEALRLDLTRALESLPSHYREVIILRDLDELTIREIAERLGLAVPAVKSRLHRARALTRDYLLTR